MWWQKEALKAASFSFQKKDKYKAKISLHILTWKPKGWQLLF
jgi:hypothetical protein